MKSMDSIISETIDILEKESAKLSYIAEAEDRSGLSELLIDVSDKLQECVTDIKTGRES